MLGCELNGQHHTDADIEQRIKRAVKMSCYDTSAASGVLQQVMALK